MELFKCQAIIIQRIALVSDVLGVRRNRNQTPNDTFLRRQAIRFIFCFLKEKAKGCRCYPSRERSPYYFKKSPSTINNFTPFSEYDRCELESSDTT
jgi:hypothetical protein